MDKQPRMTNEEAIEVIKKNYPPENYTMLREALDIAIETLGKVDPIPLPAIKQGDRVKHITHGIGRVRGFSRIGGCVRVKFDSNPYFVHTYVSELEVIPNGE